MEEFLILLIRNSTIMSLIIVVYGTLTRFYFKDQMAKWSYYSWFMAVIGLVIPMRPKFNIVLHEGNKITGLVQQKQVNSVEMLETLTQSQVNGGSPWTISWPVILSVLWLIGFLGIITYHGYRHYHFVKMIKRWGREIEEPIANEILSDVKERLNITKDSKLLICPFITSPMMIGFFKPMIILPHTNYSDTELFLVLKHELIHFKRKDLWYKSLVFFVTVMYWFNPIIYLMAKEISRQCEISCDEKTLQDENITVRKQYSEIIISTIRNGSSMNTTFTTNFYNSKKDVRNRILSIINMKKRKRGIFVTCLLAMSIMATGITLTSMTSHDDTILVRKKVQSEFQERDNWDEKNLDVALNSEKILIVWDENKVIQTEKVTKRELEEEVHVLTGNYEELYIDDVEKGWLLIKER